MGSLSEAYTDFVKTTGVLMLTGPEDIVNETVRSGEYINRRMMRGKEMSELVQGGQRIEDRIFFDEISTGVDYHPTDDFSYVNPQTLQNWGVDWRFKLWHQSWNDHEIELQAGGMSAGGTFHKFKDIKRSKDQNLYSDINNTLEDDHWRQPDYAQMELPNGKRAYSIPCGIHEFPRSATEAGPPANPAGGTAGDNGWLTFQGLDQRTFPKWYPYQATYDQVGAETGAAGTTHLFAALDRAWRVLNYGRFPIQGDLGEPASIPQFIATQTVGVSNYERSLRANQNWFRWKPQDPAYPFPTYRGADVVDIATLDTAVIYPTGSVPAAPAEKRDALLATYDTTTNLANVGVGPRYYLIDDTYYKMAIHARRYLTKIGPFRLPNRPLTHVLVLDMWRNLVARSLRRHGILFPEANVNVMPS